MAQSIQLSTDTGIVSNGQIFNVWGDTAQSMAFSGIHLKNISSRKIEVKAKKIQDSLISGATVAMCFGTACYPPTTFTTPQSDTININAIDSSFVGHYNSNDNIGESIVTFVFFNISNVNDSAWIVVHYHATPTGIKEISSLNAEISNPYPNPAANFTSFNCSIPNYSGNVKLVISNILGSKVKEINIANEGILTVNTSDLNEGVYLYSFIVNDKLIVTKKLITQH
jgi:hypothetical protein